MTGVSMEVLPHRFFQMLRKIMPNAKKIGVLYDPKETEGIVKKAAAQAKELNLELIAFPVNSESEAHHAMKSIASQIDVLWMIPDPTVYTLKSTEDILFFAVREKLPVIGFTSKYTKAGALFSLSCDYEDMGEQTGEIALKLLNGKNPHDIPIAPCRAAFLSVNLIVAERVGIPIPETILQEAKDVYK